MAACSNTKGTLGSMQWQATSQLRKDFGCNDLFHVEVKRESGGSARVSEIVWALVTPELAVPSASLAPLPAIDADFADEIRRVILTSVTNDWFAAKNSRAAEAVVAPVLHPALQTRGYVGRSPRFASYWRNGITDGAWQHEPGNPRRITLEVKVNEDTDALRPNYRRPLTPSSHCLTPPGEVAGAPGRIGRG